MWKRLIKRGEKVALELTRAERRLLLTGLVFLHRGVEEAIRSTPPGDPVMLTLSDLEDMAGHVAGEANHAKSERTEAILSDIFEQIEGLLDLHAEEPIPAKGRSSPPSKSSVDRLKNEEPRTLPQPARPKPVAETYPVKLTGLQREAMVHATRLRRGIKNKLGQVPEGTQTIRLTRKELDETAVEVNNAIDFAPNPDKKRLVAVRDKIEGILDGPEGVEERPIRTSGKAPGGIYQFKVTLKDTQPPVWRRFQVTDGSLGALHEVLQVVMGWQDAHLHQFVIDGVYYGPAAQDDPGFATGVEDEGGILLCQVVKGKRKIKFRYDYDFGAGWRHDIVLEEILEPKSGINYPLCLEGERACPPEDVGGPWAYADFLAAIGDPKHVAHRDMKEWIGGRFDPEGFSVEAVNNRLVKP
jgi:hypothetical protein